MNTNTDIAEKTDRELSVPSASFVARQAILDDQREVCGYELLFRNGDADNGTVESNGITPQLIAERQLWDNLERLTQQHKAFLNITKEALLIAEPGFLPANRVVIELASPGPEAEILEGCKRLKEAGYTIAFDAGASGDSVPAFLDVVDMVKVDFLAMAEQDQNSILETCKLGGVIPIAKRIESYEQFEAAGNLGYQYFQGFFFGQPETLSNDDIPASKLGYLRVLRAVSNPDFSAAEVARAIKTENALSYLLLRYMNSAFFSFANEVESIQHAVTILGNQGIRKWASFLALSGMNEDKPSELAMTSLVRGSWCESLNMTAIPDPESRFLLGLLSLVDAVMDRPMKVVLDELPISPALREGLVDRKGPCGSALGMLEMYELGKWHEVQRYASELGTTADAVAAKYLNALGWAHRVFASVD